MEFAIAIALAALGFIAWDLAHACQPIAPVAAPVSRKHVRCGYPGNGSFRVAYYNESGSKVTVRTYPDSRYFAVRQSARAKGYRVI